MSPPPTPGSAFDERSIRGELEQLLKSEQFERKQTLQAFLSYIVEEELLGRGSHLHAMNIAIDCFGKDAHDNKAEVYVRNIASKTRRAIDLYYRFNASATIEVSIPKGSYRPHFVGGAANTQNPAALQPSIADDPPTRLLLNSNPNPAPTIAFIPPRCLSGSHEDAILGDVIANELSQTISGSHLLRVISNRTASLFKESALPLSAITQKLGSDYVVRGEFTRRANAVGLELTLWECATGEPIWSFAREMSLVDIVSGMGGDIREAATEVGHSILRTTIEDCRDRSLESLSNHSLFLGGLRCMHAADSDTFDRSRHLLSELKDRLPDNPIPLAALARWSLLGMYREGLNKPGRNLRDDIIQFTHLAFENDPEYVDSLMAMANLKLHLEQDNRAAQSQFKKATKKNPNNCLALAQHAVLLNLEGNHESAVDSSLQAIQRSPFDPELYFFHSTAGASLLADGEVQSAIEHCELSLNLQPNHAAPIRTLINCYSLMNDKERAVASGHRLLNVTPGFNIAQYITDFPFASSERGEQMISSLYFAEIPYR